MVVQPEGKHIVEGMSAFEPVTRDNLESHAVKDHCHVTRMPSTSFSIRSWMKPNTLRETRSSVSRLGSGAVDPAPSSTSSPGRVRGNAHLQKREFRGNAHLYSVLKFILTVYVAYSRCVTVEARSATTVPPMQTVKTPYTAFLHPNKKRIHQFFFIKGRMRRLHIMNDFLSLIHI